MTVQVICRFGNCQEKGGKWPGARYFPGSCELALRPDRSHLSMCVCWESWVGVYMLVQERKPPQSC